MVHSEAAHPGRTEAACRHRAGTDPSIPSLVMLHGLFGKLTNFEPVIPHILPQIDIWVPELPLYANDHDTDTIAGLSSWLETWLNGNNITSAVLLGNSLGGHIALDCAIRGNSPVNGLVLVGSSGLFDTNFGDSIPRRFDRAYIHLKASEAFQTYRVDEDMVDEIYGVITNRTLLGKLVRLARSARYATTEPSLPKIDVPTCIIWGENDRITPPPVARKFHSLIPGSELKWIADCGHVPMMDQPEAFAAVLNDFMLGFKEPSITLHPSIQLI